MNLGAYKKHCKIYIDKYRDTPKQIKKMVELDKNMPFGGGRQYSNTLLLRRKRAIAQYIL